MKRPCNYPGCPVLLEKGTYCPKHQASAPKRHTIYDQRVRAKDPALALAHKIRSSTKWAKLRRQFLTDNPCCADPFGEHARTGITRTSTQVHHIKGLATHPHLWNHAANLQALCTACHARVEREHRAASGTQQDDSHEQSEANGPAFG